MRERELKLAQGLEKHGVPYEIAKRYVSTGFVRANPHLTTEDLLGHIAANRLAPTAFLADLPISPTDALGWIADFLKFVYELLVPPPPPRPQTFQATTRELVWCQKVKLCDLQQGDYATIKTSNNGGTFPLDTPGTVELSKSGSGPVDTTIRGNGTATLTGPCEIWAHLTGGTEDNKDEDACDISVDIERFGPTGK